MFFSQQTYRFLEQLRSAPPHRHPAQPKKSEAASFAYQVTVIFIVAQVRDHSWHHKDLQPDSARAHGELPDRMGKETTNLQGQSKHAEVDACDLFALTSNLHTAPCLDLYQRPGSMDLDNSQVTWPQLCCSP